MSFVHLHVHTQYSILDGFSSISKLFARADELGMPALAITDHGNMYGVKEFFKEAKNHPDVKPIIGCEVYVTRHFDHTIKDTNHRSYYHLILLAKNYNGYRNLMKIVSTGHIEGSYYGKPRVSHEVIEKYHEDLICCSACLAGELPRAIVAGDMDAARAAIEWHRNIFGDDYYLEVQSHKTEIPGLSLEVWEKQQIANAAIFDLAQEFGIKVVATNDVHFVNKEDGPAHDRLICLNTNAYIDDPDRMRYTQQEYLKTEEEMGQLFPGHPEVLSNTLEVADKCEKYKIDRDHVLPKYEIEPEFLANIDEHLEKYKYIIDCGRTNKDGSERGEEFFKSVAYLCHITYAGAHKRYGETFTEEQSERITFELQTICRMGFPDYFLIVQDYIAASRAEGYMVGPGRGSAAGSVVAYCLGITNLDPIRYQLLFERFLNPDRISMPDIDVDFENLPAAHEYVERKYSSDHVSRVITFGTMAAKSAIKDVARISHLTIDESNRLTKMVPDRLSEMVEAEYPFNPKLDELKPGFKAVEKEVEQDDPDHEGGKIMVKKWFQKGKEEKDVKITLKNCYRLVPDFINELKNGTDINKEVLRYALQLEGSIRQVGVHACATIIGRGNLTDYIPICLSIDKDTNQPVWTSQYDGHYIEDVGMLKMDFLGLNTLTIIHTCLDLIKERFGIDIDIEAIPIDDAETYEKIYSRGDTMSVFQFESPGMMNWLQRLHPERFEDLIAMNALYRPGPMDYIPSFVARKLGQEEIAYDLPEMEEYLAETYGVTVYQEQVMLLSRKLANFTKGEADKLRKAMGKKQIAVMQELKEKFMTQGMGNGHPEKTLDKIWKDWEKFAQYAFNKSHATCYAWVSYQTGWLKCHYPAEFQAANLSCNLSSMDEIKKIMADCKKSGIRILNPDVNESLINFNVNKQGEIRFGFGGIRGFGSNISVAIIDERNANGAFKDIWDFAERMGLYSYEKAKEGKGSVTYLTKKVMECLVYSGAFDSFGYKREQYYLPTRDGKDIFADAIVAYADNYAKNKDFAENSLFGGMDEIEVTRPEFSEVPSGVEKDIDAFLEILTKEKDLVGMYLSNHPLEQYRTEIDMFVNTTWPEITTLVEEGKVGKVTLAAFVLEAKSMISQKGSNFLSVKFEDFDGQYDYRLYGSRQEQFMGIIQPHTALLVEGEIKKLFSKEGQPDTFRFDIMSANLLSNAMDLKTKALHIFVDTKDFTPAYIKQLKTVLRHHKGKKPLHVWISDKPTGYNLEFESHACPVTISAELLQALRDMKILYKVIL